MFTATELHGFNVGRTTPQPDFANVIYLPDHENAANDSTAITDLATGGVNNPHTFTYQNQVINSTADSRFGSGSSILFDGSADHLWRSAHADFVPSSDDDEDTAAFCWEFHFKLNSLQTSYFYNRYKATSSDRVFACGFQFTEDPLLNEIFFIGTDSVQAAGSLVNMRASGGTGIGQWYHYAISRERLTSENTDTFRLFIDGNMVVSEDVATTNGFGNRPTTIRFGDNGDFTASLDGRLDNIRIVIGEPVYTRPFRPPTSRHPTP